MWLLSQANFILICFNAFYWTLYQNLYVISQSVCLQVKVINLQGTSTHPNRLRDRTDVTPNLKSYRIFWFVLSLMDVISPRLKVRSCTVWYIILKVFCFVLFCCIFFSRALLRLLLWHARAFINTKIQTTHSVYRPVKAYNSTINFATLTRAPSLSRSNVKRTSTKMVLHKSQKTYVYAYTHYVINAGCETRYRVIRGSVYIGLPVAVFHRCTSIELWQPLVQFCFINHLINKWSQNALNDKQPFIIVRWKVPFIGSRPWVVGLRTSRQNVPHEKSQIRVTQNVTLIMLSRSTLMQRGERCSGHHGAPRC